jgi:hypothetical protein
VLQRLYRQRSARLEHSDLPSSPRPTLAAMLGLPKAPKPRPLELCECPHCASRYVHPTQWQAQPDGAISLHLRCPECFAAMEGTFPAARVRELDRELAAGRASVRDAYERIVRRHMYQELQALRNGLVRDLIGADDFRPRNTTPR